MATLLAIVALWFLLSLPVGLVMGRLLARAGEAYPGSPPSRDEAALIRTLVSSCGD